MTITRNKRCQFLGHKAGVGRTCSSPDRGGVVDHRTDCQACPYYAAEVPTARVFAPSPLPPRQVETTTVTTARVPLPCVHEGRPSPPPEGKPTTKSYLQCDAGLGVVCRCNCNPSCKKYEAEADDPAPVPFATLPAKPVTPQTPDADMAALIRNPPPPGGWPKGWPTWDVTKRVHQVAADEFVRTTPPYPTDRYTGRGVVIAGGGRYWPSVYVTIRMLRHVGCKLPVEIWYLGRLGERDARYERLLAPLGVAFVDADTHPARAARRILNGFEIKLFAALNSSFAEVLYLDADNYPCADPTVLFDDRRYRMTGGVYWPDLPMTEQWTHWEHWGVAPYGPKAGLETGQYLLNKAVAWEQLCLAEWYDDHSDWCYGAGKFSDHGDKGVHRVSWAKYHQKYTMFSTDAVWKRCAFLQPGPDGRTPMFVHRCRSKFALSKTDFGATTPQNGLNQRHGLPMEAAAFRYLEELRQALK